MELTRGHFDRVHHAQINLTSLSQVTLVVLVSSEATYRACVKGDILFHSKLLADKDHRRRETDVYQNIVSRLKVSRRRVADKHYPRKIESSTRFRKSFLEVQCKKLDTTLYTEHRYPTRVLLSIPAGPLDSPHQDR